MKLKYMTPGLVLCFIMACNLPRPTPIPTSDPSQGVQATTAPALESTQSVNLAFTAIPTLIPTVEPSPVPTQLPLGGEPLLVMQPGSGYVFGTALVVHGSDDRDIWWNGLQIVPNFKLAMLGPTIDLSAINQISQSAMVEQLVEPVPGEAYAFPTLDDQYALIRIMAINAQTGLTIEWLYPYAGQVVP